MPVQFIQRLNISEKVFEQFKGLILSGEWKQGEKIPSEVELAETIGVSRISVRAALQKLASLGLVERRQGYGTIVCNLTDGPQLNGLVPMLVLSPPSIKNMNEFRMILECAAVELAAERRSDDTIKKLEDNLKKMVELSEQGKDCAIVDTDFHYIIAEATQNPLIIKTMELMKDTYVDCMRKYKSARGEGTGMLHHKNIIDAIRHKDAYGAKKIMEEHLRQNYIVT